MGGCAHMPKLHSQGLFYFQLQPKAHLHLASHTHITATSAEMGSKRNRTKRILKSLFIIRVVLLINNIEQWEIICLCTQKKCVLKFRRKKLTIRWRSRLEMNRKHIGGSTSPDHITEGKASSWITGHIFIKQLIFSQNKWRFNERSFTRLQFIHSLI